MDTCDKCHNQEGHTCYTLNYGKLIDGKSSTAQEGFYIVSRSEFRYSLHGTRSVWLCRRCLRRERIDTAALAVIMMAVSVFGGLALFFWGNALRGDESYFFEARTNLAVREDLGITMIIVGVMLMGLGGFAGPVKILWPVIADICGPAIFENYVPEFSEALAKETILPDIQNELGASGHVFTSKEFAMLQRT